MSGKIKTVGRNLGLAIAAILVYELVRQLSIIVGDIILGEEKCTSLSMMVDSFCVMVLLLVYLAWLYRIYPNRDQRAAMISRPLDRRTLLALPVVMLGVKGMAKAWLLVVAFGLQSVPMIAESSQSHTDTWSDVGTQPYLWVFLSVVLVGPIVEELLFRGLVFHYLEKIRAGWFPILVSGILFGLWHQEPVQCVYASMMGIAVGIVYANVRNLKVVMALHICSNFLSTLPPALDTGEAQVAIILISLIMIIPAIFILVRMHQNKAQRASLYNV